MYKLRTSAYEIHVGTSALAVGTIDRVVLAVDSLVTTKVDNAVVRRTTTLKLHEISGAYFTIVGLNAIGGVEFPKLIAQISSAGLSGENAMWAFREVFRHMLAPNILNGYRRGEYGYTAKPHPVSLLMVAWSPEGPVIQHEHYNIDLSSGEINVEFERYRPAVDGKGFLLWEGQFPDVPILTADKFIRTHGMEKGAWMLVGHACEHAPESVGWPVELVTICATGAQRQTIQRPVESLPPIKLACR